MIARPIDMDTALIPQGSASYLWIVHAILNKSFDWKGELRLGTHQTYVEEA
jgi:hypothetical protein